MYDVVIIGAGVTGTAVARELSRYQLKILVLEKEEDVCCGTSKANSAIIHAGYDAANGSLKAKMNVRGNELMGQLASDLEFPFERVGSLVVAKTKEDVIALQKLKERGEKNGVKGLEILEKERLYQREPNLSKEVVAALYAPTAGIVCPFEMNIAMAENAYENGVEFLFYTQVQSVKKRDQEYELHTNNGSFRTKWVVNAAGVYADVIHNMVSQRKLQIIPGKGEYCLLDKSVGDYVKHTIFSLPTAYGKGILVTPTVAGNLLLGPTAQEVEEKDRVNTTIEGMEEILQKAGGNVKNLPFDRIITSFAGLRAHERGGEFIIEEVEDAKAFIDCVGIESPGLTSAPAIAERVADIIAKSQKLKEKPGFRPGRKAGIKFAKLSFEEKKKLIKERPEYGNIICRCEMITEGEILDAIHRPLGARSLDGVKRRTRAGMGRCQSGFCSPRVIEILSRQLHLSNQQITKSGYGSEMIGGCNKEGW